MHIGAYMHEMQSFLDDLYLAPLPVLAAVFIAAFGALALVDGFWLHLAKYRLFARPESRIEHWLHTARAALFPAIAVLVFALPTAGPLLWAGVGLLVLDEALELADGWVERSSRRREGGLPTGEYLLHGVLIAVRAVAVAFALVARPAAAWAWSGAAAASEMVWPEAARTIVMVMLPGAIVGALVHVALGLWYRDAGTPVDAAPAGAPAT